MRRIQELREAFLDQGGDRAGQAKMLEEMMEQCIKEIKEEGIKNDRVEDEIDFSAVIDSAKLSREGSP